MDRLAHGHPGRLCAGHGRTGRYVPIPGAEEKTTWKTPHGNSASSRRNQSRRMMIMGEMQLDGVASEHPGKDHVPHITEAGMATASAASHKRERRSLLRETRLSSPQH